MTRDNLELILAIGDDAGSFIFDNELEAKQFTNQPITKSKTRKNSNPMNVEGLTKSFGSQKEVNFVSRDFEIKETESKEGSHPNSQPVTVRDEMGNLKFEQDVRHPGKLVVKFDPVTFSPNFPDRSGIATSRELSSSLDKLEKDESKKKAHDDKDREKFLATWRYVYALLDFSKFTTVSLKDSKVYTLFKDFIHMSCELVIELSKAGPNFSDISNARNSKIGYQLINEMMMDKLFKVFYTVFASDNMQATHDSELNKKFLTIKSRLLELFILIIVRVKNFPFETISTVIRELNRDPNILLHMIDDCSLIEPGLFALEYRNFLKTTCLIPSNLYQKKVRFISLYFPCFFYSLMGERLISKASMFPSLLSQCLQAIKDEPQLSRRKSGTVCATFFAVYVDYRELLRKTTGKGFEEKVRAIRQFLSPSILQGNNTNPKPLRTGRGRRDPESAQQSAIKSRGSIAPRDLPSPQESLVTISLDEPRDDRLSIKSAGIVESTKKVELRQAKDEDKSSEDSASNKSCKSFINTLNDEYLKESDYEEALKNFEEITQFCNEVLLGKNQEILKIQCINLVPVYLVLKLDLLLNKSDLQGPLDVESRAFSTMLFKGFIKSIAGREDQVLQSYKVGEILAYCFLMIVDCTWEERELNHLM